MLLVIVTIQRIMTIAIYCTTQVIFGNRVCLISLVVTGNRGDLQIIAIVDVFQKCVVRCRKYRYTDMRKLPKARNELLCTDLAKISLPGLNSGHHSNREMESQWKVINFLATMDFLI